MPASYAGVNTDTGHIRHHRTRKHQLADPVEDGTREQAERTTDAVHLTAPDLCWTPASCDANYGPANKSVRRSLQIG